MLEDLNFKWLESIATLTHHLGIFKVVPDPLSDVFLQKFQCLVTSSQQAFVRYCIYYEKVELNIRILI